MNVMIQIPDGIAATLAQNGVDLSRRALENFALEELRSGRISEVQLRLMLDLGRIELEGFLKEHGIFQHYTLEDFEEERCSLIELGL